MEGRTVSLPIEVDDDVPIAEDGSFALAGVGDREVSVTDDDTGVVFPGFVVDAVDGGKVGAAVEFLSADREYGRRVL